MAEEHVFVYVGSIPPPKVCIGLHAPNVCQHRPKMRCSQNLNKCGLSQRFCLLTQYSFKKGTVNGDKSTMCTHHQVDRPCTATLCCMGPTYVAVLQRYFDLEAKYAQKLNHTWHTCSNHKVSNATMQQRSRRNLFSPKLNLPVKSHFVGNLKFRKRCTK